MFSAVDLGQGTLLLDVYVPNLPGICIFTLERPGTCDEIKHAVLSSLTCPIKANGMIHLMNLIKTKTNHHSLLRFPHKKTMFGSSLPPVVCMRAHVLFTLFVLVCI